MVPCDLTKESVTEQIEWVVIDVVGDTPMEIYDSIHNEMIAFCKQDAVMACVYSKKIIYFDRAPEISFTVYFPSWSPSDGATVNAESYWKHVRKKLCLHELGHIEIGLEWRRYVFEELLSEPIPWGLRGTLKHIALQALEDAHTTYDQVTQHGRIGPSWRPTSPPDTSP